MRPSLKSPDPDDPFAWIDEMFGRIQDHFRHKTRTLADADDLLGDILVNIAIASSFSPYFASNKATPRAGLIGDVAKGEKD